MKQNQETVTLPKKSLKNLLGVLADFELFRDEIEDYLLAHDPIFIKKMKQARLYALLFHHAADLMAENADLLFEAARSLKNRGLVEKIGVSVYSPAEIEAVTGRFPIDLIQAPFNVLDQRILQNGLSVKLKAQGIELHVRSIFLQGILLCKPEVVPSFFQPAREKIQQYQEFLSRAGLSPLDGALQCALQSGADAAILGISSLPEFQEILCAWKKNSAGLTALDFSPFALEDEGMVNPARWPKIPQGEMA